MVESSLSFFPSPLLPPPLNLSLLVVASQASDCIVIMRISPSVGRSYDGNLEELHDDAYVATLIYWWACPNFLSLFIPMHLALSPSFSAQSPSWLILTTGWNGPLLIWPKPILLFRLLFIDLRGLFIDLHRFFYKSRCDGFILYFRLSSSYI